MLVFVYGTLRKGQGNHGRLAGARFVGRGKTVDRMTLLDVNGYFPAVVPIDGPSRIVGEVYDVDAATLKSLDQLEGYPHHYDRKRFDVELLDTDRAARHVVAWIYFYPPDGQRVADVIPSGDWCDRLGVSALTPQQGE